MASHIAAMLKAARQVPQPDMAKADLENLRKVSQRFAYGTMNFRYALALALNGDSDGASRQMAIIRGMYGESYYAACKEEMRRLEKEKYPQLAAVVAPLISGYTDIQHTHLLRQSSPHGYPQTKTQESPP